MKLILAAMLGLVALPAVAGTDQARYLRNGYSLLYHLGEQEKPLELILIVKTTPREVADFAHEVSRTARTNTVLLDDLAEHDPALRFDDDGLPAFEADTRKSIRGDKQQTLLFGTTDRAFARALLVTQIEAGTYGMNLAKVLADAEPNAHRADVVHKVAENWRKLRDKAYRLLNSLEGRPPA